MSEPYIGEIRTFAFTRVPTGWLPCDGNLYAISGYEALFALLGTTYGGDGSNSFGVPDLRGRLPLSQGTGPGLTSRVMGEMSGSETVTLMSQQMPAHSHPVLATTNSASSGAVSTRLIPGAVSGETAYATDTTGGAPFAISPGSVSVIGGNQPHDNTMPTLTTQICIAYAGIWPSQG